MNMITSNHAAEINRHHELACARADEAVSHAIAAGRLLLQAKASLKHGQFLAWCEKNLTVTARQAQRYIAAALGKPAAIRSVEPKTTSMSHLAGAARGEADSRPVAPDWNPQPAFVPAADRAGLCSAENGWFVVEPSSANPGFFFVSRVSSDERSDSFCAARPVRADWVEKTLQFYGLPAPAGAEWHFRPCGGVQAALETVVAA